jgi:hypothetical protein
LELAWYEHPFVKNQFIISSEDEIKKISGLGLNSVKVDFSRSRIREEEILSSLSTKG